LIKVWRAASAIAPVRRRVSGLLGTTADRPGPRTVARRRILRSCTAWPVALAPSRGAAARPVSPDHDPLEPGTLSRGRALLLSEGVPSPSPPIPPGTSSQRQTRMVSERPRSAFPCTGRGHCPHRQAPPSRTRLRLRSRRLWRTRPRRKAATIHEEALP
jgi:hypothetical protein